jgi:plastocyanin domain-containing protein
MNTLKTTFLMALLTVLLVTAGGFSVFNKSAKLPEGETVPVEFLPSGPGEYELACQMDMFRGKLIVE